MAEEIKKEVVFSKEQLKNSKSFEKYKDIVTVVMADDEKITKSELQKRIDKFLKKEVK
ncbi:hypothetical protein [Tyzzerella sp. An114]|mgnify:FL=1|uniref:hypothetical protein n=1 Tax=Tyzzerella sp. An114 TaxID=1965545 RepID=UPI001302A92F|nr:hypothetical protein [Tyzzerella sp. An114]